MFWVDMNAFARELTDIEYLGQENINVANGGRSENSARWAQPSTVTLLREESFIRSLSIAILGVSILRLVGALRH